MTRGCSRVVAEAADRIAAEAAHRIAAEAADRVVLVGYGSARDQIAGAFDIQAVAGRERRADAFADLVGF